MSDRPLHNELRFFIFEMVSNNILLFSLFLSWNALLQLVTQQLLRNPPTELFFRPCLEVANNPFPFYTKFCCPFIFRVTKFFMYEDSNLITTFLLKHISWTISLGFLFISKTVYLVVVFDHMRKHQLFTNVFICLQFNHVKPHFLVSVHITLSNFRKAYFEHFRGFLDIF